MKNVMDEEMTVLHSTETWTWTFLPFRKHTIGCWWKYTVKLSTWQHSWLPKAIVVVKNWISVRC